MYAPPRSAQPLPAPIWHQVGIVGDLPAIDVSLPHEVTCYLGDHGHHLPIFQALSSNARVALFSLARLRGGLHDNFDTWRLSVRNLRSARIFLECVAMLHAASAAYATLAPEKISTATDADLTFRPDLDLKMSALSAHISHSFRGALREHWSEIDIDSVRRTAAKAICRARSHDGAVTSTTIATMQSMLTISCDDGLPVIALADEGMRFGPRADDASDMLTCVSEGVTSTSHVIAAIFCLALLESHCRKRDPQT